MPRSAWYCIEPTYNHATVEMEKVGRSLGYDIPESWSDEELQAFAEKNGFARELSTEEDLLRIVDNFERYDNEGKGILVTRDHLSWVDVPDTGARGWIKALCVPDGRLWAWIEWTDSGHALVNSGEYCFFSTEYEFADFRKIEGGVTPTALYACTITNTNRHKGQVPITNSLTSTQTKHHNQTKHMKPKATRNRGTQPITGQRRNSGTCEPEKDQEKAANSDADPDDPDTATNSETDPDETDPETNADGDEELTLDDAVAQIAEMLGLDATANPASLVSAVSDLQRSNEELTSALAEANKAAGTGGAATNSARYPGLFGVRRNAAKPAAPLKGHTPNRTVTMRINGADMQVPTQDMALVDYCRKHVKEESARLGRPLSPAEYNAAYNSAVNSYSDARR
ncbi:hypothetical protein AC781_00465 [Akkermansia glycaniphila]|nr:hypothetical protein AC781_10805 [Akkermansia glycaniphila]OCA04201.1 hypothetical protein AC781_00465 [Akkermansia glycaniphila]